MAMKLLHRPRVLLLALLIGILFVSLGQAVQSPAQTVLITTEDMHLYRDPKCTITMTAIDWGTLYPGSTVTRTVFVRNEGDVVSLLQFDTVRWNPEEASAYLVFNTTYRGEMLLPGQVVGIILSLYATPDAAATPFKFTIVLDAYAFISPQPLGPIKYWVN